MAKKVGAGQAVFQLVLDDRATKALQTAAAKVKAAGDRMKSAAATIGRVGAGAARAAKQIAGLGLAAAGAAAAMGKAFANYGDAIDKMSIRTDISRETLQELRFAAEQTGTSVDSLGQALFRARRRIGNAITGTGPAVRAFDELGISASKLSEVAPAQQFEILADALKGVGNEARRNQLGFEIFGDNFRDIQPLIDAGSEAIEGYRKEARELGMVLSESDVKKAAELQDAFNRAGSAIRGAAMNLAAEFAPMLIEVLNGVAEFAKNWKGYALTIYDAGASAFEDLGLKAIKVFRAIEKAWVGIIRVITVTWNAGPAQRIGDLLGKNLRIDTPTAGFGKAMQEAYEAAISGNRSTRQAAITDAFKAASERWDQSQGAGGGSTPNVANAFPWQALLTGIGAGISEVWQELTSGGSPKFSAQYTSAALASMAGNRAGGEEPEVRELKKIQDILERLERAGLTVQP